MGQNRRPIIIVSLLVIVCLATAGYSYFQYALLQLHVAFAEGQTVYFEEDRRRALASNSPDEIVALMESTVNYYPSGTKQPTGTRVDRIVERARNLAAADMILRLKQVTGLDLGKDPAKWIEKHHKTGNLSK